MEEEGDVVYFQSSPQLNVYKEADIDVTDNVYQEEQPPGLPEHRMNETAGTTSTSTLHHVTSLWLKLKAFLVGSRQGKVKDQLFNVIKHSPLLTEDDYQHLSMSLKTSQTSSSTIDDNLLSSLKPTFIGVLVILFLVFIAFYPLSTTWLLVAGGIFFKLCFPFAIFSRQFKSCDSCMTDYLNNCDKFLLLLTKSMRCIQERELVHNGFDRPSVGVPMSRLESHIERYQCRILRVRVFSLCQKGVWLTRNHVCSFVNNFPLSPEMDNIHDYMSFKELSDLHKHLDSHHHGNDHQSDSSHIDDSDVFEEEDKPVHLTLHSLRTAASLFAITNSELLRRIALLVGGLKPAVGIPEDMLLNNIVDVTKSLNEFVINGIEDLQWSIQYYNNPLKADTTPTSSSNFTDTSFSTPSITELELHSSDLQILTALNKVRELNINDNDELEAEVLAIVNHLNSAERHLRSVLDHLENSKKALNGQSTGDDSLSNEHTLVTGCIPSLQPGDDDDTVSIDEELEDDEKIYEAMVMGDERLEAWDCHETEEAEVSKTQKEVSLKMLNELNSVLAVRKVERQKKTTRNKKLNTKKEKNEDDGHKEKKADDIKPENSCTASISENLCTISENSCAISTSKSLKDITPTNLKITEDSVNKVPLSNSYLSNEAHKTESRTTGMEWRLVENESKGSTPLNMREGHVNLLALVAASRAKVKKEEVFVNDNEEG